ncbi:hypothetical protein ACFL1C_09025, partial [Pseudomonadota bacterium]
MKRKIRLIPFSIFIIGMANPSLLTADIGLEVPIYDGQTWTAGCQTQINGVVWPVPPESADIVRIEWDWGDG